MYPYGGGYGGNQAPPGYGGYSSQGPSGMGPPPGMGAAPGGQAPYNISPPPGIANAQSPDPGQQAGFSTNFQAPSNMPNVNLAAPIIRLGSGAAGKPGTPGTPAGGAPSGLPDRRPGLGLDASRTVPAASTAVVPLAPPSADDVLRTIFVRSIGTKTPDAIVERVLRAVGSLRRFIRATDADNKPKDFGFAEYNDWNSFGVAVEVLKGVEIKIPKPKKDSAQPFETFNWEIVVDEKSIEQLSQESSLSGDSKQSRIDTAQNQLDAVLDDIANPNAASEDTVMYDAAGPDGEIVTIPLSADDELADIPAELRETVAAEITAFRERSNRRDLERMKREEELEEMERNRTNARLNRLASPSSGPSGANGVPSGPKDRNTSNSKSGSQLPKDYQKGVNFVNDINGDSYSRTKEEEESDASDSEIERRRRERKDAQDEKSYLDQERRWLNREKSRAAAVDRERGREENDSERQARDSEAMAKKLREWDDDVEATRKVEDYYGDHSSWARSRQSAKAREAEVDDKDRLAEEAEQAEQKNSARDFADNFLDKQAQELSSVPRESRKIQLSLGAAAQKVQAAAQPRRTVADVEGLLEDEEEAQPTAKRTLIPIQFDRIAETQSLTEEEREQAVRQLANDIPNDQAGLWNWDVSWKSLTDNVITEKLKPFVEKKIMEYLGVQEQMLVDVVEEHLRNHKSAAELVSELEMALDEEAEVLVRKLWRMVIFFSESEKRGLSA